MIDRVQSAFAYKIESWARETGLTQAIIDENAPPQEPIWPRLEFRFESSKPVGSFVQTVSIVCRVIIVTKSHEYSIEAMKIAMKLQEIFTPGTALERAIVQEYPHIPGGYKDGTEWRQPVIIRAALVRHVNERGQND